MATQPKGQVPGPAARGAIAGAKIGAPPSLARSVVRGAKAGHAVGKPPTLTPKGTPGPKKKV